MCIRADELLTGVHVFSGHTENTLQFLTLCTASLSAATPRLAAGGGRHHRGFSCLDMLQSMDGISVASLS